MNTPKSDVSFWQRRRTWVCIVLLFFPLISVFVVTRPFVLSQIVEISLQSKIGTDVEVSGTSWDWGTNVFVKEINLKARGVEGLAANVISLEDVFITLNSDASIFSPEIVAIEVETLRVRLAESLDYAGEFNFSSLVNSKEVAAEQGVEETSGVDSFQQQLSAIPELSLNKVIIETGVMNKGDWTLDGTKTFSVLDSMYGEEESTLQLVDSEDSLQIDLSLDTSPLGFTAEADNIKLDNSILDLLPRTARVWCNEAEFHGDVNTLRVVWNSEQSMQFSIEVENISFNLPQEHGIRWASFRNGVVERVQGDTHLDVNHGHIVYDGRSVYLNEIRGLLVPPLQEMDSGLEFSSDIKIYDYKSVGEKKGDEWMSSLLSNSPFEASFTINDFVPERGNSNETIVPIAAAQILKLFQLSDWKMNAKVFVARSEQGEEVEAQGDLIFSSASGMYEYFTYPLKDIKSHISFRQNDIKIVYLNALGSEDAEVHISGGVKATNDLLVVDLNLYAKDAPLDQKLHDALSKPIANVMERLIDHEAFDRISKSLKNSDELNFDLGGDINLDLNIKHDSRLDSGIELSGEISFENVGILHRSFPFPVVLKEGTVSLDPKGLYIPESKSIRFKGRELGVGGITGSIYFLEDGTAIPDLKLELLNEYISSDLLLAVSESAGDDHELAAGVLGGLGLSSKLNAVGSVKGNKDGTISTNFLIGLMDGVSTPNEKLTKAIGVTGPFWPDGFKFTNINAEIHIDNGSVSMQEVTCKCEDGSLTASMSIDKGEFDLKIQGDSLPISANFVDVLPNSASKKLSSAWQRLNPSGEMDAVISMSHVDDSLSLNMNISPTEVKVHGLDRVTTLNLKSGSIIVDGTDVYFNTINFQLQEENAQQGSVDINGEVHGNQSDFGYMLDAKWSDAVIDSPLARAITGIVGGKVAVDFYDTIEPSGIAAATLSAFGDHENLSYNIDIIPDSLTATFHDREAVAFFDRSNNSQGNTIRVNNDSIYFDYLFGKLGDGEFSVDGKIESGDVVDGKFDLTWSGPSSDDSLYAILPEVVGDTLVAIKLQDGLSTLPDGKVSFRGEAWDKLAVSFDGNIEIDGASIDVGVPLEEIKGVASIFGRYSKEKLDMLELSLAFDELSTLGRLVTDIAGSLEYNSDTNQLAFKQMRGESANGGVTVQGWLGLDHCKEYEIEVLIAGVELSSVVDKEVVASLTGDLMGWFSVAGVRGDLESRRGAGKVLVENGRLEIDPLSLTTMKILQFAWPSASTISGAEIDFYISGDQIALEDIVMRSDDSDISDLALEGDGSIDFDTFQIHARLHPRVGLPIIRDIVGAVNDQLYSIDVTGELLDPEVSVLLLPFLTPRKN